MIYKNNPKTTGNCLCLENFALYKIYKKIESTKDTLYIALVISKKLCTELCGNGSILVICQELFEKDFDMFFRKKGNFNRPSVCFTQN